jgi:hypothetical protein
MNGARRLNVAAAAAVIGAARDRLERKIQDRYHLAKDQVHKDVDDRDGDCGISHLTGGTHALRCTQLMNETEHPHFIPKAARTRLPGGLCCAASDYRPAKFRKMQLPWSSNCH